MAAKNCDECAWFLRYSDGRCAKGHSPRFYTPRADQQHLAGGGRWGWMRVCEDFKRDTK